MKALSIKPHWAAAIIFCGKDIENRSFRTHYRGPLFIHASGSRPDLPKCSELGIDPNGVRRGAIIGQVELVDCVRDSPSKWAIKGEWHWVLRNPVAFKSPVTAKGRLGIWNFTDRIPGSGT